MWISVGRGKLWIQFKRLDTSMLFQKNINKINHARWTHFDLVEAWTAIWNITRIAFYVLLARLVITWTSLGGVRYDSAPDSTWVNHLYMWAAKRTYRTSTHALETFSDFVIMMNKNEHPLTKFQLHSFIIYPHMTCIYIYICIIWVKSVACPIHST